ncbi:hypothetical protein RN001_007415 [Aquatica leii]|uniref:Sodium channel protein n=1 Tax=Aquatica leii TaxID=1421715 RepID=A0AAN7SGT5_9COLE|nr:hypothetical protein RN001_007415 [Aquatica leii]
MIVNAETIPIWKFPFPAVTICDNNQISKTKIQQVLKKLKVHANMKQNDFEDLFRYLITIYSINIRNYTKVLTLQNILDANNMTLAKILKNTAPDCKDIFVKCFWKNKQKLCKRLFVSTQTSFGVCCSFNEVAYRKPHVTRKVLLKSASPNKSPFDLSVIIRTNPDDYYSAFRRFYGFNVFVHKPFEPADVGIPYIFVQKRTLTKIIVEPVLITMGRTNKKIYETYAKCNTNEEHRLQLFNFYTKHNCYRECLDHAIMSKCNCARLFANRFIKNVSRMRSCNFRDVDCIKKTTKLINCDCPHNCKNYNFDITYSVGSFMPEFFPKLSLNANDSVLQVGFSDITSTHASYAVRNTWISIFSFTGGILSLFIGFHFKAIIEIIYFLTVNIIKDRLLLKQKKKQNNKLNIYQN